MSPDAAAELNGVRHMQLASAVGIVIELHQTFENASAALLTALAGHFWRLEYAGSSVMRTFCSEAASPRMADRILKKIMYAIFEVLCLPRRRSIRACSVVVEFLRPVGILWLAMRGRGRRALADSVTPSAT
jgi:hypothetical protein